MTYDTTPRADRIRVLRARRDQLDALIRRLEDAERQDGDGHFMPPTSTVAQRRAAARKRLIAWSQTAEFARRVALYGRAPGRPATRESEAS